MHRVKHGTPFLGSNLRECPYHQALAAPRIPEARQGVGRDVKRQTPDRPVLFVGSADMHDR